MSPFMYSVCHFNLAISIKTKNLGIVRGDIAEMSAMLCPLVCDQQFKRARGQIGDQTSSIPGALARFLLTGQVPSLRGVIDSQVWMEPD